MNLLTSKKVDLGKNQPKNINENKTNSYLFPNLKIGIIIPAYNEANNIENPLSKIPENLSEKTHIIVVDDGSTDNTSKIAEKYGAIVLKHHKNRGNGAATITGINYCKQKNFDIILIIDADGQHNPIYIPKFIKKIVEEGYDFVIGNRFKYHYKMNPYKKFCSKVITAFYLLLFRRVISDPTNGYRALYKSVFKKIDLDSHYSVTQEMLFKIIPEYQWEELPIRVVPRENGKSFIKLGNYFFKIILIFLKYYLFPRIRFITEKVFSPELRNRIENESLKT